MPSVYNPLRTTCGKTRCCVSVLFRVSVLSSAREKKFQTHVNIHKLKSQFDSFQETLRLSLVKSRACLQRYPDFIRFSLCPLAVSQTVQQALVTILIQSRKGNRRKGERRLLSSSPLSCHQDYFIIPPPPKKKKKKKHV